nr:MAG TPA_asm: hypothetical protein [Bacteriophage sp.]
MIRLQDQRTLVAVVAVNEREQKISCIQWRIVATT